MPADRAAPQLEVRLDTPLPRELWAGGGTALFVAGSCFATDAAIRRLGLTVDGGAPQPVMAQGMPRLDLFRMLHPALDPYATARLKRDPESAEDPGLRGYASGFWGIARIGPGTHDRAIGLDAELDDGRRLRAQLGTVAAARAVEPVSAPTPAAGSGPLVAICMATHNPPVELLERQLDSIREQTHRNWVCVVSDDCSEPERFAELERRLAGDERFVVSRSPERLGFYRNFERALALAPADAQFVAMADQDDRWYPDKLESLLGAIGGAQLVYSDARIVGRDGAVRSETYWTKRRNNHTDMLSLLVANSVTGAASLMRRDLLDAALPFPPAQFAHFHDHWVAVCALALGEIRFVARPLYDYVQHGSAVVGHATANILTPMSDRLARLGEDPRERIRRWRMVFFLENCRLLQFATVLELRCGDRMARAKRRELNTFLHADRSTLALARLGLRAVGELRGRNETLGAEVGLFLAFFWRRLLAATARERPSRRLRLDALPPSNFAPRPGASGRIPAAARVLAEKVAPLDLVVREGAPARVNVLVPTIDLDHFFGGYIAKFNLARRLAERGLRVRIVTLDAVGPLPRAWQRQIESYAGLAGLTDRVEITFGRGAGDLEVSRSDRFVATTWWSAHVAAAAVSATEAERFLYLIQEHEPFTFPMGSHAALATQSYAFPHFALFSTELLREWFRLRSLGVYAEGAEAGDVRSASFQNAITDVPAPSVADLAGRDPRRLLFYARPEPHAARNMFELGVLALQRALAEGAFAGDWELHGVGTVEGRRRIALGGAELELLPRSPQSDYADMLAAHDVGLALMHTPHPSLVPLEMASAGMLAVTNSFENKTAAALAAISPNLIAAEPTVAAVAGALCEASAAAGDLERRAAGARVRWSRDWDSSFGDELMDQVGGFLAA